MRQLWPDTVVEENNLTVNVSLLRKALGEGAADRRYIETLPRRGYRFVASPDAAAQGSAKRDAAAPAVAEQAQPAPLASAPVRPFVGRARELHQVQRRFEGALSGGGRLVFVTGSAGMGKTEFCSQFVHPLAQREELFCAHGHCFEHYGANEAYLPFLELMATLLGSSDSTQVADVLRRHAPSWYAQLPAAWTKSEVPGLLPSAHQPNASRMVRELGDALQALSQIRPLLLVVEDVHWADPSSCDVLRLIAQRISGWRALVLATFRPDQVALENDPLKQLFRDLLTHDQCDEVSLPVLEATEIHDYLAARFGNHDLPDELGSLIARTSEGQPLFATRLVQLLLDRGDIQRQNERWALARPVSELEWTVPDSVRALIERKLESLPTTEQRVLTFASVVGVEFSSALLALLCDEEEVSLEERLHELARRHRLLESLGEETGFDGKVTSRYRFAHVLYQNVLYDRVASQRRLWLHGRIAEHLLAEHAAADHGGAAQIALHFEAARNPSRAIEFWMRAADNAARLHADREAKQHYARALGLVDALAPSARVALTIILYYNHACCCEKLGDAAAGLREFQAMLEHASSPAFTDAGASAERAREMVFDYFEQPWRDASSVYDMARMPNQPRSLGPSAIQCEAYWCVSYTLFEADQLEQLAPWGEAYLRVAEQSRNEPRRAEALGWMAVCQLELANLERAFRLADESIRIARDIAHPRALFVALGARAKVYHRRGRYQPAREDHEESLGLSVAAQSGVEGLRDLGETLIQLGNVASACAALEQAEQIAERTERAAWVQNVTFATARLYLELGAVEPSLTQCARAVELARQNGARAPEARSWIELGRAWVLAGDRKQAADALQKGRTLASELAVTRDPRRSLRYVELYDRLQSELAHAEFQLFAAELDLAATHARNLLQWAAESESLLHRVLAHRMLAHVELARGSHLRALEEVSLAATALGEHPAPLLRLRVLASQGLVQQRAGQATRAQQTLITAQAIVEQISGSIVDARVLEAWNQAAVPRAIRDALRLDRR
jgi:tetratricopeptide (TPR) repeat protein